MSGEQTQEGDGSAYRVDMAANGDRSASSLVVGSIAELTDRDPSDLEPLWDSIDPEALESFVDHASERSIPYHVAFRYEGYTVAIDERRQIRFTETDQ